MKCRNFYCNDNSKKTLSNCKLGSVFCNACDLRKSFNRVIGKLLNLELSKEFHLEMCAFEKAFRRERKACNGR